MNFSVPVAPAAPAVPAAAAGSVVPAVSMPDLRQSSRVALGFLVLALILGGVVGAYSLFLMPFAINDGWLFWAMTRAIADANFALPTRVFYPTTPGAPDLPFCYPPLGFYVAAALFKIGVPLAQIFRWLPWAWTMATIWAFWRLARAFWRGQKEGEWAAGAATLCWALLPWSFIWSVMGGGLTRAPGMLWAFLAIEAAIELWRDGRVKKWLPLAIFLALGLATHLERARFAVVAVGLVWLFYGRSWRGAAQLVGALAGAILVTAPWWGLCLARFGLAPFVAASESGGSGWTGGSGLQMLVSVVTISLTGEAILPLFHLVGAAGLLWCLWRRQWFLPVWFALIVLMEVRSGRTFVLAPLALGAGFFLARLPRARVPIMGVLAVWLFGLGLLVQQRMPGLAEDDLAALGWASRHAAPDARFLVLPNQNWAMDAPGEWFPALTGRAAVATVQGAEWLPNAEFRARRERHDELRRAHDWNAVAALSARDGLQFDWVWLPRSAPRLEPGAGWEKQWSQGQSAIWRRAAKLK